MKDKKYLCVRIYEDDTVQVVDAEGKPISPMRDPKPLVGPINTYGTIVWSNQSPTCVNVFGKQY
ncbi:MAG TPA: hypothetical protein VFG09_08750 [Thermodesulfovibrionales bacterium]|nr:hypothetical protein [Thermodesulfovibrionales bacterium]